MENFMYENIEFEKILNCNLRFKYKQKFFPMSYGADLIVKFDKIIVENSVLGQIRNCKKTRSTG
jgi:hypothetical protein